MKILLRILLGLVTLSVVAVAGAYAILSNMDLETYRSLIREQVKEATGRDLRMDGPINLALSFTPSVAISDVGLQNASWGSSNEMVSIKKFEAELNLIPLLSGQVDVSKVILDGATILLETNAQGQSNFVFDQGKASSAQSSSASSGSASSSSDTGGSPVPVVRKLDIRNADVRFIDATTGADYQLNVERIGLEGLGQSDAVELQIQLAYNGIPVDLGGSIGAPEALLDAGLPWKMAIAGNVADIDLSLDGQIQDVQNQSGIDVKFTVEAEKLAELAAKLGQTVPDPGTIKASGQVSGDLATSLKLSNLAASVEKADALTINAAGDIADLLKQSGLSLAIDVDIPSVAGLNPVLQELNDPALNEQLALYDGNLIPDLGPLKMRANVKGGVSDQSLAISGLDLKVGKSDLVDLALLGDVNALLASPDLKIGFTVSGDQIANLAPLIEKYAGSAVAIPALGDYRIEGQVSGRPDASLVLHSLNSRIGQPDQNGLSLTGSVGDLVAVKGADLDLKATITDMSLFSGYGAGDLPADQQIKLTGQVKGDLDQKLHLRNILLALKETNIGGDFAVTMGDGVPFLDAQLRSSMVNIDEINTVVSSLQPEETQGEGIAQADDATTTTAETEGRSLILTQDPLPLEGLQAANLQMAVKLDNVIKAPYHLKNIGGAVVLKDGTLGIGGLSANLGEGTLRLDMNFQTAKEIPHIDLALKTEAIDLTDLVYFNDIEGAITGPMNGEMRFSTDGRSLAELGSNLDGVFKTVMLDGTVHGEKLRDMMGDSGTAVAELVTGDLKVIPVYCQVNELVFDNGVGVPRVLLLDSPVAEVLADGGIDLRDQTIDILMSPKTRALSLPVRIRGFMEDPDVKIDANASLANLGKDALKGGNVLKNLLGSQARSTSASLCLNYGSKTAPKASAESQNQSTTAPEVKVIEDVLKGEKPEDALKDALKGGLQNLLGN